MTRKIHYSRMLDIMSGYYGVKSKEMPKLAKDFNSFTKDISKFRTSIDTNMPTFYIVDIDLIAREVARSLQDKQIYQENEDYIAQQLPQRIPLAKLTSTLRNIVDTKIKKVAFLPLFTKIEEEYQKMLDDFNSASAYIQYRRIASRGAFEVGTIIKKNMGAVSSITDAHLFLSNIKLNNTFVFVGSQFDSAKSRINDLFNTALRELVLKEYDLTIKKYDQKAGNTWQVGNLVNAGHTAAYSGTDLVGVNMPFLQEAQFRLSSNVQQAQALEAEVQTLYTTNNYQIDFKQEYRNVAQCLLDLQFSFVVSMPSAYNTNTLRVAEVEKIKSYLTKNAAADFEKVLTDKIKGGVLSYEDISASPTLQEFLVQGIIDVVLGKNTKQLVKTSTSKKSTRGAPIQQVKKHKPNLNKVRQKNTQVVVKTNIPNRPESLNLTNLQNLLNQRLHDQIRANMGTGSSKNILNYRQGRFAQSAKVERMSESRQGMITAFYTYMKYPYATFSGGGRQQYPKSRDPKLLISKSIREIAGTAVANRMRAVNI